MEQPRSPLWHGPAPSWLSFALWQDQRCGNAALCGPWWHNLDPLSPAQPPCSRAGWNLKVVPLVGGSSIKRSGGGERGFLLISHPVWPGECHVLVEGFERARGAVSWKGQSHSFPSVQPQCFPMAALWEVGWHRRIHTFPLHSIHKTPEGFGSLLPAENSPHCTAGE